MISRKEATESMRSVEQVQRRTLMAKGYGHASGHLILGGLVWATGYVLTGLTRPEQWPLVWPPLMAVSLVGSFIIAWRGAKRTEGHPARGVVEASRILWMAAAIMTFMISSFLLFHPRKVEPYLAFPALVMGLVYTLLGAQGMMRFLWIGIGIFALTTLGLLVAPQFIAFWIAAAGGGGLILGGLWLRKA